MMPLTDAQVEARKSAVAAQRQERAALIEQFRDLIRDLIREELKAATIKIAIDGEQQ